MLKLLSNLINNAGIFLDDIFSFISAPRCPGCDEILENPRLSLCPGCEVGLKYPGDGPVCLLCRSPISIDCHCNEIYEYDIPQLFYWAPYTDIVRSLIHQLKFERQLKLGDYLAGKALGRLHQRLLQTEFDIIIPIPMMKRDEKKRTFNQTELIVKVLAEELGRPYDFEILRKIKHTRLQANLGRDERWLNIKDAFSVIKTGKVDNKSILLVDDIVTTGATTIEASKALYIAGAKQITVFAIATSL